VISPVIKEHRGIIEICINKTAQRPDPQVGYRMDTRVHLESIYIVTIAVSTHITMFFKDKYLFPMF